MNKILFTLSLFSLVGLTACSNDSSDRSSGGSAPLLNPPVITDTPPMPGDPGLEGPVDIFDDPAGGEHPAALPAPASDGKPSAEGATDKDKSGKDMPSDKDEKPADRSDKADKPDKSDKSSTDKPETDKPATEKPEPAPTPAGKGADGKSSDGKAGDGKPADGKSSDGKSPADSAGDKAKTSDSDGKTTGGSDKSGEPGKSGPAPTISTLLPGTTITTGAGSSSKDKTPESGGAKPASSSIDAGKTTDPAGAADKSGSPASGAIDKIPTPAAPPAAAPASTSPAESASAISPGSPKTTTGDPEKPKEPVPSPIGPTSAETTPAGGSAGSEAGGSPSAAESEAASKWTKNISTLPVQLLVATDDRTLIAQGGKKAPFQTIYESEDGVNWEETVTFPEITSFSKSLFQFGGKIYVQTGPPANKVFRRETKGKWVEDHSKIDFTAQAKSGYYYTKTHVARTPDMVGATPLNFPVSDEFSMFRATSVAYIFGNKVFLLGDLALKAKPDKILFGLYQADLGSAQFQRKPFPSLEQDAANSYFRMMAFDYKRQYLIGLNDVGSDAGAPPKIGALFHKSSDLNTWTPLTELDRHLSPRTPIYRLREMLYVFGEFVIMMDEGKSLEKLNCRILSSKDLVTFNETIVPNTSCGRVVAFRGKLLLTAQDLIKNQLVTLSLNP